MSNAASYIEGLRARGIVEGDLSDAAVTAILTEALSEFSRSRPMIASTTFETVEDQQAYTWTEIGDADGIMATLVIYNPNSASDEWSLERSLLGVGVSVGPGDYHLPSQEMLEQIKRAASQAHYGGSGFQIDANGGDVYLNPTPSQSGDTVFIIYTKPYSAVDDIKASDRDMFLDLVESYAAKAIVFALAKASGSPSRVRTPEYEISYGEQIRSWRQVQKEARASFTSKMQAGGAAAGRT